MSFPILFLLWFLPLVGALFLIFVRGTEQEVSRNARNFALFTSLIVFVLSLFLWFEFDAGADGFQFEEKAAWFEFPGGYKLNYHVGIDGISMNSTTVSSSSPPSISAGDFGSRGTRR